MSTLQERVQERLAATGLNPNSASAKAGLGRDYVRDILRGKTADPGGARITKLAEALECEPEYLIGGRVGSRPREAGKPVGSTASTPLQITQLPSGKYRLQIDQEVSASVMLKIMQALQEEAA